MKKIISKILIIIGASIFCISFCISDINDTAKAVGALFLILLIGGAFIFAGIKVSKMGRTDPVCANKNENNINYSEEFEKLYNKILLDKVNEIIKGGETIAQ